MSHKFIALETRSFLSRLGLLTGQFCKLMNQGMIEEVPAKHRKYLKQHPLVPMNEHRAFDWLVGTIDQMVQSRLMYVKHTTDLEIVRALFNDDSLQVNNSNLYFARAFNQLEEIDSLIIDLQSMIDNHIPCNTWEQWNVITIGRSVSLISDRDYRVVEWENLTGYRTEGVHILELDLSNIVSYLRNKINATVGEIEMELRGTTHRVKPGNLIDFKPILQDALTTLYPRITFPNYLHLNPEVSQTFQPIEIDFDKLSIAGVTDYAMFRDKFVSPVVESFGLIHMTRKLDETDYYVATLDNSNILTIDYADASQWREPNNEETELKQLAESLIAGDYLPPDDRRRAEEYILNLPR